MPHLGKPPVSTRHGVLRIVALTVVIIALLYATDAVIDLGLRRIQTSSFGASNLAMSGQVNAEIVISGSSRALTHYDPGIISQITGRSTFNLGRNGSQTDMQLAYLRAYLKNNAKPELIIHNLDLFSFLTSKEVYDPVQYLPYIREDSIYSGILRVYPDAWKWRYFPLYGYVVEDMRFTWMQSLRGLLGFNPREDHFQGYQPRHQGWTGDFEKFKAGLPPTGIITPIEPQGVEDLRAIAQLCREASVPLIFVYSPEYIEIQPLETNRAEVFTKFKELCEEFQVQLWDYSLSPISETKANFYNSQHLNVTGATAFSEDVGQRLTQLSLLTQASSSASAVGAP